MSSSPVLDNTKMMLEVLNEDEINAVQGVAKAFLMNSPFMPKTEEELVKRIDGFYRRIRRREARRCRFCAK